MQIAPKYFAIDGAPASLQFFRCVKLSATLSTASCAVNWRQAHDEQSERLFTCRTCPVGAMHAGEAAASLNAWQGATICGRCHRGTTRLIEQHLCPSCWNREREFVIGKNAKGQRPVKLAMLHRRALRIFEGGAPRLITRARTAHVEELYAKAMRDCKRRVVYCWDHSRPALFTQRQLW